MVIVRDLLGCCRRRRNGPAYRRSTEEEDEENKLLAPNDSRPIRRIRGVLSALPGNDTPVRIAFLLVDKIQDRVDVVEVPKARMRKLENVVVEDLRRRGGKKV